MNRTSCCSAPMSGIFPRCVKRPARLLRSIAPRFSGQRHADWSSPAPLVWAWPRPAASTLCRKFTPLPPPSNEYIPDTDAVIELGGEDAKIIFFGGALEERMNGSCAGGTGAFIDQMATLMNVTADELDDAVPEA